MPTKAQGIVLAQGSHVDLVQMDVVFRDGKYSSTRDVHAFLQVCSSICELYSKLMHYVCVCVCIYIYIYIYIYTYVMRMYVLYLCVV
jgi:hypothetical protein